MNHTPEPWRVSGTGHICAGDKVIPYDDLKADARRIVACVNACAGIPNGNLEAGGVLDTVLKERDELLAALNQLQYAYRQIAGLHDPNTDDAFTVIAHNAIAKAKGA